MMIIDLSSNPHIPEELAPLYNEVAKEIRKPFCDTIESITNLNRENLDWFLCGPASRNIFSSPLFSYCCGLAFVQRLVDNGMSIDIIVTDSPVFRNILNRWAEKRCQSIKVQLKNKAITRLHRFFFSLYRLIGYPIFHSWMYLQAKRFSMGSSLFSEKPITLIDTFVMDGFIEKERYFPGLLECLDQTERENVYFVPSFYRIGVKRINKVLKRLRSSGRNIVMKEYWLRFSDYLFAFLHVYRVRRVSIRNALFKEYDISDLIKEEIISFKGFGDAIIGLLNYKFAYRLKKADIPLKRVVDSFENQVVDKGWNAGFNKYFPEISTAGYLGVITTSFYLCSRPTDGEKTSNLLPQEIYVTGKALVKAHGEFCKNLTINVAPAFRFSHLFKKGVLERSKKKTGPLNVLVALPFDIVETKNILGLIDAIALNTEGPVNFMIKAHPTTAFEKIKNCNCLKNENVRVVTAAFDKVLEESDLLVSSASSVCLETISRGTPVIVMGNRNGLTLNTIPDSIKSDIWRLCYSEDDMHEAIRFYHQRDGKTIERHQLEGRKIRDGFFSPVTTRASRNFLLGE